MASRFYLHGAAVGNPSISPGYGADWNRTSDAARRFMSLHKPSSVEIGDIVTIYGTTTYTKSLGWQFISHAPLAAQTISGNVKGQLLAKESSASGNFQPAMIIKAVSSDGATVRGTLLSYFPGSLTDEIKDTAYTNAYCPPSQALSPVVCQEGDRLVIEVGFRNFMVSGSAYIYLKPYDRADLSDLPEDNTTTGDYNAWIEFDSTIDFYNDRIDAYSLIGQVEHNDAPNIRLAGCLVQVEYMSGTVLRRVLPVPPAGRVTQSQTFKRRLPQWCGLPD